LKTIIGELLPIAIFSRIYTMFPRNNFLLYSIVSL
jgi:hypothetical protein